MTSQGQTQNTITNAQAREPRLLRSIRRTFSFVATALTSAALLACEVAHETVISTQGSPTSTAVPSDKATPQGGVDGGGGNGYNGRPLESYKINDMMALAEVKNSILPMLSNLKKSFLPLAADLTFILRERNWYMIPAALEQISATKIGVYFPTDQLAIQNFSDIWMNAKIYNGMETSDRSTILLHEMVMGVKLLQGAGALDRCLATATISSLDGTPQATYEGRRTSCYQDYSRAGLVFEPPDISLEKADYEHIRALTTKLESTHGTLDGAELKAWLKASNVRVYDAQ